MPPTCASVSPSAAGFFNVAPIAPESVTSSPSRIHVTPSAVTIIQCHPHHGSLSSRAGTQSYFDEPVIPELETLLLATWPFEPGLLTIVDGAMDAISRTLDLLLKFGDRVAVENPGFPPVFDLLDHYGTERIAVELDSEGMRPD